MNKIKPELISLFQIRIYKLAISTLPEILENPAKPANFKVSYSQNSAFNFDLKNIRIRLEILLDGLDDKDQSLGIHGDFGIEFHFHIENLENFLEESDGIKKVSSILGSTLVSIAFSTARGIILERSQNTILNGIILPIIDPNQLIKEMPLHPESKSE